MPTPATPEDLQHWHKSADEIFRYGKEIMGLSPSIMSLALITALARTLISASQPTSVEECAKIRGLVSTALDKELSRLALEGLQQLLKP